VNPRGPSFLSPNCNRDGRAVGYLEPHGVSAKSKSSEGVRGSAYARPLLFVE
jgi:hypothetical protein